MTDRILISGASVAGPALALLLGRAGYEVTVVERAAKFRDGGHAVDFRGETHFRVLERMGVLGDIRKVQTRGGAMRFIDQHERTQLLLPAAFAGGDLEVRRADLSRILYEHSRPHAKYVFGDSISALDCDGDGVDVTFSNGSAQRFDLVVGADGIYSKTRRLLFGRSCETYLGYCVAGWDLPRFDAPGDEAILLNTPGKMIGITPAGRRGGTPGTFCIFSAPEVSALRGHIDSQKQRLRTIYSNLGWRVPELLEMLDYTDDVFVSSISRADPEHWWKGRVALVGDAASGVAIGGMGTGMAIVGAYVLANELCLDRAEPVAAFRRYQQRLAGHVRNVIRTASPGPFLAPRTRLGLSLRNTLLSLQPCKNWLLRESNKRSDVIIPEYPLPN
jgi:2-polyprenyl-6-methoxyphenol hydroxylase-like FAD-dependent oxidoreductase